MSNYKQLTYEQRCQIEALKRSELSQEAIGLAVGTSQSSISRELSRNQGERGYRHRQAQIKASERRKAAVMVIKMKPQLLQLINEKLSLYWSPEQISGWLLEEQDQCISHESIYRYVWANKKTGGVLHTYLRRRGRRYQWRGSNGKTSRGQIKNRVSIDNRPAIVDEKMQVGHWEIDTVIGKGHSGALVTIVERVTKFTLSCRVLRKSAVHVTAATIALLAPFKAIVRSITADNGKEFAYHEQIAENLKCDVYFAHPYCSWERGLNENTNGLLRQDFPKRTDFKQVTDSEVRKAVNRLNDRPRKLLAFKTPAYLMREHLAALAA